MSTSPETSPKASPSSKLPVVIGAVVGVAFFVVYMRLTWPAIRAMKDHAQRVAATADLVQQAKLWPETYETAEVGKPVIWCVDYTGGQSYMGGKPSQPIAWKTPPPFVPRITVGHCDTILARVEDRKPNLVTLTYLGQP